MHDWGNQKKSQNPDNHRINLLGASPHENVNEERHVNKASTVTWI